MSRNTSARWARRLVIMVKEPRAGAVKTRLARDFGAGATVGFYRALMARTLRHLGRDPRWQTVLAVAPDIAVNAPVWPDGSLIMAQGGGDLGTRMDRVMISMPPGPVAIIGSDVPGIRPAEIAAAFDRLGSADAVFGPAPDGGYWLVGLRRSPNVPRIFDSVRWSSAHALEDTVSNLRGRAVAYLGERDDIDTIDDYRAWRRSGSAECG